MTPKQAQFLREYRKDQNAAAAARRMGYRETSARTVGHRLLHSEPVQQALTREVPVTSRVLEELQSVAFGPGSDEKDAPVKLTSKLKALELLGKSLGLFEGAAAKPLPQVTILEDLTGGEQPQPWGQSKNEN